MCEGGTEGPALDLSPFAGRTPVVECPREGWYTDESCNAYIDIGQYGVCTDRNFPQKEYLNEYGTLDSTHCGSFYPDKCAAGQIRKLAFPVVHRFCRREPFSVIADEVVSDGGHPGQARGEA